MYISPWTQERHANAGHVAKGRGHGRFGGVSGGQIKAMGAGGDCKPPGHNKLWSVCAADATGPVSKDGGEQLAVTTSHRWRPSCPRAQVEMRRGNMAKDAEDIPGVSGRFSHFDGQR
jgi:hypothetical protein